MNILVTGGTGFIGSSVTELLRRVGHTVSVFDITLGNDIRDTDQVKEAVRGKDVVVHLSGILGTDELFDAAQQAVDVNIKGAVNVLEACVEYDSRYVGITMLTVFESVYTATKVSVERFASAYNYNFGLPVTHVRAFNAYGPRQAHGPGHPRKIIPAFSVEGWSNKPLTIWGDGTQIVDLVDVEDVARVFLDALNAPGKCEVIDAGTCVPLTVNEVAAFVLEVTGSTAGVEHMPMRRGEKPTRVVSEGVGWEHLTFKPKHDELKLLKTIVSYKDHECVQQ